MDSPDSIAIAVVLLLLIEHTNGTFAEKDVVDDDAPNAEDVKLKLLAIKQNIVELKT